MRFVKYGAPWIRGAHHAVASNCVHGWTEAK